MNPSVYRISKAAIAVLVIAAFTTLTACGGSLAALAKAEADITATCTAAYTVTAQGATAGLISQSDATVVMNALLQIELANKQAITATAAINALNTTNSASLLTIIAPVQTALANIITGGLVGIKDPTTQKNVLLALTAVNIAITSAVTIIQAVK